MPLVIWESKLLVHDGKLAASTDCCCGGLCDMCIQSIKGLRVTVGGWKNFSSSPPCTDCSNVNGTYFVAAATGEGQTFCSGEVCFSPNPGCADDSKISFCIFWELEFSPDLEDVVLTVQLRMIEQGSLSSSGANHSRSTFVPPEEINPYDCEVKPFDGAVPLDSSFGDLCDASESTVTAELVFD